MVFNNTEKLLLGKNVAQHIYARLHPKISQLKEQGIIPTLRVISVGEDPASKIYVHMKDKKCKELGIDSAVIELPKTINTMELLQQINTFNNDILVHAILVQLPLPSHIDSSLILSSIDPTKDADGFHELNVGKLQNNDGKTPIPCTANAVIEFFKYYNIHSEEKHIVVIGRSTIVGRPLSILLSLKKEYANATVTLCHSKTPKETIKKLCLMADIIIVAIGVGNFLTSDMVSNNAIVIDVGINRVPLSKEEQIAQHTKKEYKLIGDTHFDALLPKCSYITPVPGGVGTVTIASLMQNTIQLAEQSISKVT